MTSLGITLLTGLHALRSLGIATDGLLAGTCVEAGGAVPWDNVVSVMDGIEARLPRDRHPAFAADWLCRHPTFRAASLFVAGPSSWLELLWQLTALVNPAVEHHYEAGTDTHRLTARLKRTQRPCRLWFEVMHHWAIQAPVLLDADALTVRSVEVTGSSVTAHYEPPAPTSSVQRASRATHLPLRTIFTSLRTLEPARLQRFHDGHQLAERSRDSREAFVERFGLTPREHEVLGLLADGLMPREVARELSMRLGTARVHLRRIYAKTNTGGQRELLARLQEETLR